MAVQPGRGQVWWLAAVAVAALSVISASWLRSDRVSRTTPPVAGVTSAPAPVPAAQAGTGSAQLPVTALVERRTEGVVEQTPTDRAVAPSATQKPPKPAVASDPASNVDEPIMLPVETALMTEDGVNARTIGALMKGDDYDTFLSQLAEQAASDPLSADLQKLYADQVVVATAQVPELHVLRLHCGRVLCAGVASARSMQTLQEWLASFASNPAAPPHGFGIHEKHRDDGSVEFRFTFANDPERRGVVHPPIR